MLFGILIFTSFSSCDEGGDPNPGGTTTGKFAGDWYISLTDSDGASLVEHALHSTYNTAANDNTMWINDYENGYFLKCKITMDVANGTFTAVSQPNLIDATETTVTITDGKIEKGAGLSQGGHVVDKISFKAHFSYDIDGYDILYVGHKRTGFAEDEY
ncbi:lipid-binding protein [Flavobacterium psychrotolerans]|uniref:lipid-binding protein n=1 Tax=Flavobacterium psychrotolerans TaxID=2169410 RepID=UPI00140BB5C2|nr:lipid-binding protein [Flavobacterium psychrotolerans]